MKNLLISMILLLTLIGICIIIFIKNKDDDNLIHVKVAEVARTIFYAPWYVALSNNYFEDEGLEVEVILTPGADKVAAAVLSGDVNIGFCGPEASIYVYNGGEKDYIKTFAGLTKRDGTFIVAREKIDDFKLSDLKGKTVVGGRKGGMPEMTFEMSLRENDIDPNQDLIIDTSVAFPAMQGAFIGGTGDFVTLFEPNATEVEKQGYGYVVAAVGTYGGEVPYTAFNARKNYLRENPKTIQSFTNAINKGLIYVKDHNANDIANLIIKYFPDTSQNDLVSAIKRYKEIDAWKSSTRIEENEWIRLQQILKDANELAKETKYSDLIETEFFNNVK